MTLRNTIYGRAAIALALASAPTGCAMLRPRDSQLGNATAQETYASAALTYRLDPARVAQSAAAPTGDAQLVSYIPDAPATPPGKTQLLSLKYPHPSGRAGYALAEVVVTSETARAAATSQNGWMSGLRRVARENLPGVRYGDGIEAAYALDIPIGEVDTLIRRLDSQGYFGESHVPVPGAELTARINGLGFQKPWHAVPELNALIARVRREGTLVSHHGALDAMQPSVPDPQLTGMAYTPPAEPLLPPGMERLPPVR